MSATLNQAIAAVAQKSRETARAIACARSEGSTATQICQLEREKAGLDYAFDTLRRLRGDAIFERPEPVRLAS